MKYYSYAVYKCKYCSTQFIKRIGYDKKFNFFKDSYEYACNNRYDKSFHVCCDTGERLGVAALIGIRNSTEILKEGEK